MVAVQAFTFNMQSEVDIMLSYGTAWQTVAVGCGEYKKSSIELKEFKSMLLLTTKLQVRKKRNIAIYYTIENGALNIHIRHLSTPHNDMITFKLSGDKIEFLPLINDFRA